MKIVEGKAIGEVNVEELRALTGQGLGVFVEEGDDTSYREKSLRFLVSVIGGFFDAHYVGLVDDIASALDAHIAALPEAWRKEEYTIAAKKMFLGRVTEYEFV